MPQKPSKFQPKSRGGKGNFEGRGPKPAGGARGKFSDKKQGFGKKFDGDAPRGGKSFGDKKFGDRPKRDYGDRPQRSYDDRPKRSYDDRPKRDYGDRPKRDFDDRPRGKSFGDRPKRDYDDRPRGKSFGDRPKRDFGDRPKRDYGDRPQRSYDDRPKRAYDDRPKRDYGDRPKRDFDDRPRGKSFGDKKFGDKKFGAKKFDRADDRKFRDRDEDRAPARAATDETRQKLKSGRASYGSPSPFFLYGVHAVTQALLNEERHHNRLLATEKGLASIEKVLKKAEKEGRTLPPVTLVEAEDIDRLLPRDAVHQELLLDSQPLEEVFLQDVLLHAEKDAAILVLDQVTDPHNVGAIIRSAAAFGAIAVVAQKLHAPDITGVLAKSASGAVEHVPLLREVNLSRTLDALKEAGFTCIGLAERGETTLAGAKPKGKVAIVLGAEGDGLRRLVAENCDLLARLPTQGEIASLNVSNAAAIALYELSRLRG